MLEHVGYYYPGGGGGEVLECCSTMSPQKKSPDMIVDATRSVG